MNHISPALKAHYALSTTTLAQCWLVTLQNGTQLGFTTNSADIVYPPTPIFTLGTTPYASSGDAQTAITALLAADLVNNPSGTVTTDAIEFNYPQGGRKVYTIRSAGTISQLVGSANTTYNTASPGINTVVCEPFTATASGTTTEFDHYARAAGNFKFGIYSNSSGNPGTLLGSTGSIHLNAGANKVAFPAVNIVSGTIYHLAVNSDTANSVGAYNPATNVGKYVALAFSSAFPATWSSSATHTLHMNLAAFG